MKTLRILTIAIVMLLVALAVQPAVASCGGPTLLATNDQGEKSFIWTEAGNWATPNYFAGLAPYAVPAQPTWTADFAGQWWGLGTGDPAPGSGDDSNTWTVDNWAYYYAGNGYYYGGEIFGGWGQSTEIDGCILNNPARCTCLALTDQDGADAYLALLSGAGNANSDTFLNQDSSTDGAGNNGPIILRTLAAPTVTNSVKNTPGVDVTIDVPLPTGYYEKGGCDCLSNMAYNILAQEVARGGAMPSDRDPATWTVISAAPTAVGTPGTATAACTSSPDVDLYVTYELVFDTPSTGGMPSGIVAANSTRLSCGSNPTLADPVDIRRRVKPNQSLEPKRGGDKSGGRGR